MSSGTFRLPSTFTGRAPASSRGRELPFEDAVIAEPCAVAPRQPEPDRLGSSAQRCGADPVGVAKELADHQSALRLQDSVKLAQRRSLIGDLAEHCHQIGGVKGVVLVREIGGITSGGVKVLKPVPSGAPKGVLQHFLLEIEEVESTAREDRAGSRQAVMTGPRTNLEDSLTGGWLKHADKPFPSDDGSGYVQPETLSIGTSGWMFSPPKRGCERNRCRRR